MAVSSEKQKYVPDRYELLEKIAEGMFGELFRAQDVETGDSLLIKIASRSASNDPDFRRYVYDRWADKEKLFQHPNIINVREVGEKESRYYLVVENPDGEKLTERLRDAPINPEQCIEILHQISEALRAAHRRGVVHGHLRPSDIYLTTGPNGTLTARVLFVDIETSFDNTAISLYGEAYGVPKYMAPEVIKGQSPSEQSDIFSLGIIAYELLTGDEPFKASHAMGYLFANCHAPFVPPHELEDLDVPPELSLVIGRCLERDTQRRYGTVQRLIDDLDRCLKIVRGGHVTVVPQGTDSAFAREYEITQLPPEKPDSRKRPGVSIWSVVSLVAASLALVITLLVNYPILRTDVGEVSENHVATSDNGAENVVQTAQVGEKGEQPEGENGKEQARQRRARARFERAVQNWQQRYSLSKNYELAIAEFRDIAAEYPNTEYAIQAQEMLARVYCEWGKELEEKGNYADAQYNYEKAISFDRKDGKYRELAESKLPEVMQKRVQYCYRRGLYEQALEVLDEAKERFPQAFEGSLYENSKSKILLEQGFILWKHEGKTEGAIENFHLILEQFPRTDAAEKVKEALPELRLDMARQDLNAGKLTAAREKLEQIKTAYVHTPFAEKAGYMEAEVLYKLYESAEEMDSDSRQKILEKLLGEYFSTKWGQLALRMKLDITREERTYNAAVARDQLKTASNQIEAMKYDDAIKTVTAILQHTSPDSQFSAEAAELLPKAIYYQGTHYYGIADKNRFEQKMLKLTEDFSHSKWGKRAAQTIDESKHTPKGMVYVPDMRFYMGMDETDLRVFLRDYYPDHVFDNTEEYNLVLEVDGYASLLPGQIVSTDAFYIDKTEVTNREYYEFVVQTGHEAPVIWPEGKYPEDTGQEPVRGLSLEDAMAYAEWRGKRLPSEREWEGAARGTSGRLFPWGNSFNEDYCRHMQKSGAGPVDVGSFPEGASPCGALDMIGNVWEWTNSYFKPYPGNEMMDRRAGYGEDYIVARGGSWAKHGLKSAPVLAAFRLPIKPDRPNPEIGFRCVKDVK
jgi:formylglycine-generating enzyme required for sulfatase activity/serine/threonine protein kinase